jgi:predicted RecB family nuclease
VFIRDDRVYYSASDLKAATECEWALMRKLDAKLGRTALIEDATDAMLARASELGNKHETWQLNQFVSKFGDGVAVIDTNETRGDPVLLAEKHDETLAALRSGKDVVFQATFLDRPEGSRTGFVGFADFLVRDPATGAYEVWDTKLARKARVTALLQLAAYSDQLRRLGIPVSERTVLLLGNREPSEHRMSDIEPVFHDRVARLVAMIEERWQTGSKTDLPLPWGAPGYTACGRCEWCTPQVEHTQDVILVAGMRTTQRARLAAVGIRTIEQLATSTGKVDGIGDLALQKLRAQAAMQLKAPAQVEGQPPKVDFELASKAALSELPPRDPGDIFFDFEGDPLWTADGIDWGLDYLWGVVYLDQGAERFFPIWAHDRDQEKQALLEFLTYVQERRRTHPGMHIYHYADYERAHLLQLTARYGVGEAILDELLTEDVFVDLYPIVRRAVRISENSYSIKKLEPLYMGTELRQGDLKKGDESIQFYVDYTQFVDDGDEDAATAKLEQIRVYNEYDCVSTHRLRDWLLALAEKHDVTPLLPDVQEKTPEKEIDRQEAVVRDRLYAHVEGIPILERSDDQRAIGLAAAAIEYHRREDKSYWHDHFFRQKHEPDEWSDTRDVLLVDEARVVTDWHRKTERARGDSRIIRVAGIVAPGSSLREGGEPYVMYRQPPWPEVCGVVKPGYKGEHNRGDGILAVETLGERTIVTLDEYAGVGLSTWPKLPMALTPGSPVKTDAQRSAILAWGGGLAESLPQLPSGAALDILRRTAPRTTDGAGLSPVGIDGVPAAIVDTLERIDRSYLAVQGPPGSGKTYVGSKVIAHLVLERGWRIGVVAQSHEVIENLLRRVQDEGVPGDRIGKKPPTGGYASEPAWTVLPKNEDIPPFISAHHAEGFVLGGTAWDFANAGKVEREALDLLVIDEAGQYSLANTIAVSVSAKRLLLLGDPQQLPQVTTGTHPEPIDTSALGWLSDGHDVLPAELGYFLEETWRMHPTLTASVSALSYEGRLQSNPTTLDRHLDGVSPGLHPVPVEHHGNSVESPEECEAVVALVKRHLGMPWRDPQAGRDDVIRPSDMIVVAPYNAQVELLRRHLADEGLTEVPVGTVDKFQGQEAAIAIVSLTASSAADVPRGISFLLQRNRLNVGISRGKWAAYLVHSPALRDYLPLHPQGLAELSGFIRLTSPTAG